jgi:hypothetical protein
MDLQKRSALAGLLLHSTGMSAFVAAIEHDHSAKRGVLAYGSGAFRAS